MFIPLGWEVERHYETNQLAVRRWLQELGEQDLVDRRYGYLRKLYAWREKTCSQFGRCRKPGRGFPEQPPGHPASARVPIHRGRRP